MLPYAKTAEKLIWQQSKLHGNSQLAPGNEAPSVWVSDGYLPGTLEFRVLESWVVGATLEPV